MLSVPQIYSSPWRESNVKRMADTRLCCPKYVLVSTKKTLCEELLRTANQRKGPLPRLRHRRERGHVTSQIVRFHMLLDLGESIRIIAAGGHSEVTFAPAGSS